MRRSPKIKRRIALLVAAYAVGLLLLEGLASFAWLIFYSDTPPPRALGEVRHATYDPELGWAHISNLRVEDMYGEGIYLETNSQGLRSKRDFSHQVPDGRLRVICSGDSFTLGYGVSNDETWCKLLESFDERFETVNMGQGGYGLDQAYLWYVRDRGMLAHDVLIFAFITEDLQRMRHREFVGYGKPRIRLVDGQMVVGNQPVPKTGPRLRRALTRFEFLRNLRISAILEAGLSSLRAGMGSDGISEKEMYGISGEIFKHLHRISLEEGRKLVLVHLPTKEDYPSDDSLGLRSWIAAGAARNGIPYIDLVGDFDRVPVSEMVQLFRSAHYSARGNRFIAERLYHEMREADLIPNPDQDWARND
jgi:hypothetical protein